MDSLTQMVLGAACGEAVLGKKIGNRALILGAIGGTIPDFDVLSSFFMNQLDSLAFHRGPMHSLLFAIVFPFIISYFVKQFYQSGLYEKKGYKIFGLLFGIFIFLGIGGILSAILIFILETVGWFIVVLIAILGFLFFRYIYFNYFKKEQIVPLASYADYVKLFFLSIVTHPLLDALTTFGTQLLWPISHTRYALSNVAIVDPLYTFPFLGCVIACGFYDRTDKRRSMINYIGIAVSSLYMIGTIVTKSKVDAEFESSLGKQNISYHRTLTTPTILNNILWYGIAEGDDAYFCGYYSIFDTKPMMEIKKLDKTDNIIAAYKDSKLIKTLTWFSDNYYNVYDMNNDTLQYNDLRYGTMNFQFDKPKDFIFHFDLKREKNELKLLPETRPENDRRDLKTFWERLKGN